MRQSPAYYLMLMLLKIDNSLRFTVFVGICMRCCVQKRQILMSPANDVGRAQQLVCIIYLEYFINKMVLVHDAESVFYTVFFEHIYL